MAVVNEFADKTAVLPAFVDSWQISQEEGIQRRTGKVAELPVISKSQNRPQNNESADQSDEGRDRVKQNHDESSH